MKAGVSFCSLWLGALIVELVAVPIYRQINFNITGATYILKYFVILLTTLALSYLLYIFAETMPKAIAIKNKEKVVVSTVNFVYFTSKVFLPVTKLLKGTEACIMRLLDVDRKEKISYKDSEIKEAVELGKEMGLLSKQDGQVIANFLRLDEMTAEDIMLDITKTVILDINSSKEEIKNKILDYGYTRMPVCDGDIRKIVGVVNIKNILKSTLVSEKLSAKKYVKPCMTVSQGKRLDLLFNEMKKSKEHLAVVVKEKDIAIGIVTMEDIIEQIVGSIEDDFEKYN